MVLLLTADTPDELPEALRADAKKGPDGRVVATLKDGWAVEDVQGLKRSLAEERAARKKFEKTVGELGDFDLADLPSAREALEAKKAGTLKSAKDIDDFKQALAAKSEAERKKLIDEAAGYRAQLEKQLVESAAISAITKAGGGKSLRALLPLVKGAARVERGDNGELRVALVDDEGRPLITKKPGSNNPMEFGEYVEQLRDAADLKALFESQAAGGASTNSQGGGSGRAATNVSGSAGALPTGEELLRRANAKAT